MGFLHDSHRELLEVARSIRDSPAFAWGASTHSGFTLNKVAEHLRTDALCRRVMLNYMTNKFPCKFPHVWSGIPSAILIQPDFVKFFQSQFRVRVTGMCVSHQDEIDGIEEYEFSPPVRNPYAAAHRRCLVECIKMCEAYEHAMPSDTLATGGVVPLNLPSTNLCVPLRLALIMSRLS
jgi:hypothetical protein